MGVAVMLAGNTKGPTSGSGWPRPGELPAGRSPGRATPTPSRAPPARTGAPGLRGAGGCRRQRRAVGAPFDHEVVAGRQEGLGLRLLARSTRPTASDTIWNQIDFFSLPERRRRRGDPRRAPGGAQPAVRALRDPRPLRHHPPLSNHGELPGDGSPRPRCLAGHGAPSLSALRAGSAARPATGSATSPHHLGDAFVEEGRRLHAESETCARSSDRIAKEGSARRWVRPIAAATAVRRGDRIVGDAPRRDGGRGAAAADAGPDQPVVAGAAALGGDRGAAAHHRRGRPDDGDPAAAHAAAGGGGAGGGQQRGGDAVAARAAAGAAAGCCRRRWPSTSSS